MAIEHFTFNADLTDRFVGLGYDLYREDPHWLPPIREELYGQLSAGFPFYRKPRNRHRHFLATAGTKTVGRVSAFVNTDLNDKDGTPVGTIGFYESVDDPVVSRELLDAAIEWLRVEGGIRRIWGPMNFDIWHGYRLMTRGFGQRPFYGEPFNKPYYPAFLEDYGFVVKQHWHSVEVSGHKALKDMTASGEFRYLKLIGRGYRFEPFRDQTIASELRKFHAVLTRSFDTALGFTPISLAEFEVLFATARWAFHPDLFTFVYDDEDKLAGFAGAFLDLSDAIRACHGEPGLVTRLKCIYHSRRCNRILFYLCGVTPEEAMKGTDFGRAVFYHVIHQIIKAGYETVLIALMARCGSMARMAGVKVAAPQRQYALYELNL